MARSPIAPCARPSELWLNHCARPIHENKTDSGRGLFPILKGAGCRRVECWIFGTSSGKFRWSRLRGFDRTTKPDWFLSGEFSCRLAQLLP